MTNPIIKIYIISLKRQTDRRKHVEKQLKELPWASYEFFDAVDAKELTPSEINQLTTSKRHHLSNGEIACAASHLGIYKKMLTDKLPYAIIVEDDVLLNTEFANITPHMLETVFSSNKNPTIVLLNSMHGTYYHTKAEYDFDSYKLHRTTESRNTEAYTLNLAAAKIMLDTLYPIQIAADHWKKILHLCKGVTCLACIPHLATQNYDAFPSGIEKGRQQIELKRPKKPISFSLKKTMRQLYRHFLIYILKKVKRYKP